MIKVDGEIKEFSDSDTVAYQVVKHLIKGAGLNLKTAVEKFNACYPDLKTTPQNLSNKLTRDSIKLSDFLKYVYAFGYTLSFEKADEKMEEPKTEAEPDKPIISSATNKAEQHSDKSFSDLVINGYSQCQSINFGWIVIAGANAKAASKWISENQDKQMSAPRETMLMLAANNQFNVLCQPLSTDSQLSFWSVNIK